MSVMHLAVAERAELVDLARELSPAEWAAPSLCADWTVRDVVAHIVSHERGGPAERARLAVRGRFLPDGMNRAGVEGLRDRTDDELLALLVERPRPSGPAALFGGRVGLTDGMVHQQDIRRAIGRPRAIDPEALRVALDFALTAPPIRGIWRARGTRLVATDLDWSHGRGPEVHGPGEALLMAMGGRPRALADLDGPGLPRLTANVGG